MLKVRGLDRVAAERTQKLDEEVADFASSHLFQPLLETYGADAEIREFVLVQALAAHSKMPVSEVVRQRAAGANPRAIATKQKGRSEDAAPKVPPGGRASGKDKAGEGKAKGNSGHGKK